MQSNQKMIGYHILLILTPILAGLLAVGMGRYHIPLSEVIDIFKTFFGVENEEISVISRNLIVSTRIPRILTALAVGAGLSVAGVAMQSMFSNPLATPDTIGVSSGASFGAVMGILLTDSILLTQLMAFLFGILATLMTIQFSKIAKSQSIVMVVLSGMIVSSFFSALVSLVKTVADTDTQLPSIVYWLMGSMTTASYDKLFVSLFFIIIGVVIIYCTKWKLNILSLTEDESESLGVDVKKFRLLILMSSTLITAASVAMCGQIGWIGLLVPHLARILVGNNTVKVVPLAISMGAVFMLLVDTFARTISQTEIPLSIITSLLGTPFFAFLISRSGGKLS